MPDQHPMTNYLVGTLPLTLIYDQLKEDFEKDGKAGVEPDTTIFDKPPTGMGYSQPAFTGFLKTYVNSANGKVRYNQKPGHDIEIADIASPACVGNLAIAVWQNQN